jgi:hypothetical protein
LIIIGFLFFSFFFFKLELDQHNLSIFISMDSILLHHLALDHPILIKHFDKGLV